MRFKFDENLPGELAALFAKVGHDAVTVLDEQIGGAKDADIAAVCLGEDRVLVTLDADFADIRAYPPQRYRGLWSSVSADNHGVTCWKSEQACFVN